MKSCLARRESQAAPSSGGLLAIDAVFRALSQFFSHAGALRRARAGALASALCLCFALAGACFGMPGTAQAAGATPGAPMIPALQSLINSATVSTAAPASGASAADAASAPSPASQAELEKSLDSVITTLDNDRQRTALVTQLKKLRDATKTVGPPVSASAPSSAGLLGAIAAGIASFETDVQQGRSPLNYWSGRFNAAGNEIYTIVTSQGREHFGRVLLNMIAVLAGWGACAAGLIYLQRRIYARFGIVVRLDPNPTTRELLIFALRRVGPWIVAFVAALMFVRSMPDSLGRTIAMVIAYAIVAGAVFSAICLIMFSLFGSGHRRTAVRLLIEQARRPLFAIGICSALGDAAVNYDVAHELGTNLAALVSTVSNMTAAVLTAYFALAFRRPVAHLIRNRAYEQRHDHKAATDGFEVLASLWHVPMLVLATASVIATIGGIGSGENVLQISVVTALLLVLAFFLSAIVLRVTRPRNVRRRRRSPYLTRLLRFAGTLITLFVWLAYFEFASRLWDVSLAQIIEESVTARGIAHALTAILITVFVSWLVWILIDTAIQEAVNPSGPRNKSKNPSMRARTMLPLVRNVLFVTILTIAGIVTAANLGINVTPLLAGAGVIGLAIGFGAQSLVSDLITGLFIIIEDTISVGDWIDIDGGHAGTVEYLSIRTVRLRDGQGAIHAIPFSQIKIVKNLSRDFAYAVFEVRVPFSADVDEVTQLIRAVGADLMADFRYRREMLGPVEVWGLDRFDPNWMVVKGQIKTRPLQQWSVARAFNLRLKRKMDEAGIEIPVPQMRIHTSRGDEVGEVLKDEAFAQHEEHEREHAREAATGTTTPFRPKKGGAMPPARDVSHEPRPAPPSTGQTASVPPQIPTAGDGGKT
ncbi:MULTISPECIES: mechanosensitive ion channel family protein [Paraburkholderia]|jgi:small conductance mechanosensitive channel|uniref:Mechanosensitive ion channel family protein n=1 Tax=Paraburkholderia hospita TaxID=169430 RepID=A0AAN1J7T9_9BURK|nr:mechanosensitive ion channel family protein [Paraburkholderia hospita]AUT68655.1 mechanosensitive ion channel family protein [Paraburkholderia hospita]OUL86314.1 mechanosensitive ion channel protein MscS [Paraburkholderia hospita]SEI25234.1 small conductance mechanosensitive channel [Paraburkholderia hospita]SKC79260.1 Small-conductance mechanosensitive channel [Burkholderia sp. CF099]